MSTRTIAAFASAVAVSALAVGAFAAGGFPALPQSARPNIGPAPNGPVLRCMPDPAIVGVTLAKAGYRPGHLDQPTLITVSFLVKNLGTQWHDNGNAGAAVITVQNASGTGFGDRQYFPRDAPSGAVMVSYYPHRISANFGSDEFVGYIDVALQYDPDDAGDGNPCNDDRNVANNHVRIGGNALAGFLHGAATTQTYTP